MNENRKLQETPRGQYVISLPAQVIRLLGWQKGDTIKIELENQSLKLSKSE